MGYFFYYIAEMILGFCVLLMVISSIFTLPELTHVERIDSTYVLNNAEMMELQRAHQPHVNDPLPVYRPEHAGVQAENISFFTRDSVEIKSWYFNKPSIYNNITILLLHDIGESKIGYIETAREFIDRGFKVHLLDIHGHGDSGGEKFEMKSAVDDVRQYIDFLYNKNDTLRLVLFGIGLGADIAINIMTNDHRPGALVAQGIYKSFDDFIFRAAHEKWGRAGNILFFAVRKNLRKELKFNFRTEAPIRKISEVNSPTLFIVAEHDEEVSPAEVKQVFEASPAKAKEYYVVSGANHDNIEAMGGEYYFNRISLFFVKAFPSTKLRTRYRKLANV